MLKIYVSFIVLIKKKSYIFIIIRDYNNVLKAITSVTTKHMKEIV
jgi:hypothetical protein